MVSTPPSQVSAAFAMLLSLSMGSCVLEPVETTGLECPCAPGWECDTSANVCVRGAGGVCGRSGAEPGSIPITDFRVEWVTANQARLGWVADNLDALFAYEVDIATSEEGLLAGEVSRTVTSDDNPELARSFLVGAAGADAVLGTTLFGLMPAEQYHVRLVAEDSSGHVTCSDIIRVLLNPPADLGFSMVDESPESAAPNPVCIDYATGSERAMSGDHYWEWTARCQQDVYPSGEVYGRALCDVPDAPYPSCWENLRIESLDYALSLDEGKFQLAFLELHVAIESDAHGYWAQLGVSTPGSVGQDFFVVGGQTVAANVGYRRYQVPLRILSGDAGVLTRDAINRGIRSFRVGTGWQNGAVVRIDGAAIRW